MINGMRRGLIDWVVVCSSVVACAGLCWAYDDPSGDWEAPGASVSVDASGPQSPQAAEQGAATQQQRRGRGMGRGGRGMEGMYKARIVPHWFADNTRFWYRNDLQGGTKEFILVDAEQGRRSPAFDHVRLAGGLSKAMGEDVQAERLPFSDIEFIEAVKAVKVAAAGKAWRCDLGTYACTSLGAVDADTGSTSAFEGPGGPFGRGFRGQGRGRGPGRGGDPNRPLQSPDGKWSAFVKDRNVVLRSEPNGPEVQVSQDGQEGNAYGRLEWSPASTTLVAWRIEPGERKEVYRIRSSPPGGGRATFTASPYALPGDKFTLSELNLFDAATRKQTKPQIDRFEHEWESPRVQWNRDGTRLAYQQVDRGHQRLRVIDVHARTGEVRNIIDEKTETFIWTAHTEDLNLSLVNWLEKTDEILYVSEADGWRHLYLYDTKEAKLKNRITQGEWVVRGIDLIDEDARQVWFTAGGRNAGQDPYFIHFYRVNFDGTGLVALTEGDGNHSVEYSPDRRYLIDTYSRVDRAPVHELRRVADGRLVCRLEEADVTELAAKGWTPPEVFVAKGRDGKTDIWGVINRPKGLDPSKKYPVIESIYAGPQGAFVPKGFGGSRFGSLTDLGFVVVQIDGMGTANRSKAFHDVCWKNLKDAGFPDRILWHKAVAAKYPWYDVTRVGVYGGSAGGQNAAGAVLFHPDFYKAAAANCGCHDNRMDKAWWNEAWMGWPVDESYAANSNVTHAAKLTGRLLLFVGELDNNVDPASTMQVVNALEKADKDFDLVVMTGSGHGSAESPYGQRRRADFFVRHLLGVEPRHAAGP